MSEVAAWLKGAMPEGLFEDTPAVEEDRDEILVIGRIAEPEAGGASQDEARSARMGAIHRFREETRERRMRIAIPAERRFGKKVSWGVDCGSDRVLFTTASVPAMTRLRMRERRVLDTLVAAGIARSRSEALAWCVRLVGENEEEWLERLRAALRDVREVAGEGPGARRSA